jgi:hypothetical protein
MTLTSSFGQAARPGCAARSAARKLAQGDPHGMGLPGADDDDFDCLAGSHGREHLDSAPALGVGTPPPDRITSPARSLR